MPRRTKEEALKTRTEVLDAAERCFCTLGVSATGIQEIADQAGCSRGAIYYHFKNQDGIMEAILDRGRLAFSPRLEGVLAGPAPIMVALRRCFYRFFLDIYSNSHAVAVIRILNLRCDFGGSNQRFLREYIVEQENALRLIGEILGRARQTGEIFGPPTDKWLGLALNLAIIGALRALAIAPPCQMSEMELLEGLDSWFAILVPEVMLAEHQNAQPEISSR